MSKSSLITRHAVWLIVGLILILAVGIVAEPKINHWRLQRNCNAALAHYPPTVDVNTETIPACKALHKFDVDTACQRAAAWHASHNGPLDELTADDITCDGNTKL